MSAVSELSFDPLLALAPGRGKAPLFCVHPAAGVGWEFASLIKHLAPDRPLYALQAPGLETPGALPKSIRQIAQDYLRTVRSVRPEGRVHLLGWSFGGAVAHEMATILQDSGEQPGLLAVLDCYPHDPARPTAAPARHEYLTSFLANLGTEPDEIAAAGPRLDVGEARQVLLRRRHVLAGLDDARLESLLRVFVHNTDLLATYRPTERYHGELLLFAAADEPTAALHDPSEWAPFADTVTGQDLPVEHRKMLRATSAAHYGPALSAALDAFAPPQPTAQDESAQPPPQAFPLPLEPESFGSRPRQHERRRRECPIGLVTLPSGDPAHLVVRYDDVARVLRDRRFSRNLRYPGAPRMVRDIDPSDNPNALVNHDPPEHTRFRQVIQAVFSPSQEPFWTPVVRRIVGELLDRIEAAGPPADLVRDFAAKLPIRVMCALMDVPAEDHQRFANWTGVFFAVDRSLDEARLAAGREFLDYLAEMIARRRAEPRDGVVDLLIAARDAEDRLSEPELVQMIAALFIGGQENMASFLARAVFTLLRHREQFDALREDPSLAVGAVEEILRFDIPSEGAFLRVATDDLALGGGVIPKGRAVQVSIASANRDESRFDDPHRFDIRREPNAHLSFGLGAHFCPGAPLARVELRTAISMIAERFPKLEPAIAPSEARYAEGSLIHPLLALPVTW